MKNNTFRWCGYDWGCTMENGRIIHPENPQYYYSKDCVNINSNFIQLSVKNNPKLVKYNGVEYHPIYSCGVIRSQQVFPYGIFSADIQLPHGSHLWPAFWLVGVGKWPDNGEIDIMEAISNKNGKYFSCTIPQFPYLIPSWTTSHDVHWEENGHQHVGSTRIPYTKLTINPANNFINYEVEWRPNKIIFRANNKVIKEYGWDVAKHLVGKQMNVIFDLWLDGVDIKYNSPMLIYNFKYNELN